jgi:putative sigma-54 modulation protein
MKVIIQGKQLKVSDGMKRYTEEHLVEPLRRFYDNEAAELRVELGVTNRNRGEAKECHLTFRMPGSRAIQIEESTPDVYASLDAAADRLVRSAKRELGRMRDPGHQKEHPLSALPANVGAPIELFDNLPAPRPRKRRKSS